jgi:hypothetical protein
MSVINFPILYIPDPTRGRPLFNGQIFVGEPDLEPTIEINQKQLNVVQEDGTVVPVDQPFPLSAGGVPVYNGEPVRLDVDGNYSIKILSKQGAQVFYIENVFEGQPVTELDLINDLSKTHVFKGGVAQYKAFTTAFPEGKRIYLTDRDAYFNVIAGTGAANTFSIIASNEVNQSIDLVVGEVANIKHFGAVGDNVFDNTTPIQLALDSPASAILVPRAQVKYKITDVLTAPDGKKAYGKGWASIIAQATQNKSVFAAGDNNIFEGLHPQVVDGDNTAFTNCIEFIGSTTGTVKSCFLKSADVGCNGVFAQNSQQLTIKGNIIYGGLWDGSLAGPAATSSDILFYSSSASAKHIVEGNMCLSNNSQGIFVDALGFDADVAVSNNICITLDTTTCVEGGAWSEAVTGGVRRHGIMVGYLNSSVDGTRCTINNNLIKNTRWTGIYKQGTSSGVISITDNVCTYNGYQTVNSLSAGIYVNVSGNEKVSGNSIDEFQNTDLQGVGGIVLNAGFVGDDSVLVSDNKIKGSLSHGLYITTQASRAAIKGNHIINPALSCISVVNTTGGGHTIHSNYLSKDSDNAPAIDYSRQGATIGTTIKNNTITGANNTTSSTDNTGIRVAGDITGFAKVIGNEVKNFYYAYSNSQYWSGRVIDATFEGNIIEDCNTGFNISGTSSAHTVPLVDNRFINVTNKVSGNIGAPIGRVVSRRGDRLIWESSSVPTAGSWAIGDQSDNTAPVSGGNIGWVCTADGAPGTWKEYGVIS